MKEKKEKKDIERIRESVQEVERIRECVCKR